MPSEFADRAIGTIAVGLLEAMPQAAKAVSREASGMSNAVAHWLTSEPAQKLRALHPEGSQMRALADAAIEATPPWIANVPLTGTNGLDMYKHFLKIPESDLDIEGFKFLDIGAGAQQEFARDMRVRGYKSTVFSIDPRLALSDEEDVRNLAVSREYRLQGRHHSEPNTFPYMAHATLFPDNYFNRLVSLYSMPMYLHTPEQIGGFLSESTRVLMKGEGIGTFNPVNPRRAEIIRHWLEWKGMKGELVLPDGKNIAADVSRGPSGRQYIYK